MGPKLYDTYVVSGRFSSSQPNFSNIPKHVATSESIYSFCKKDQYRMEYDKCGSCRVRFRCWTVR